MKYKESLKKIEELEKRCIIKESQIEQMTEVREKQWNAMQTILYENMFSRFFSTLERSTLFEDSYWKNISLDDNMMTFAQRLRV